MAVINAGVTSQVETAKATLAAHGEIMARVLAGLEAFGIAEGGGPGPGPELRAMSASGAGRAVAVGETEIRITVSVVYAIE